MDAVHRFGSILVLAMVASGGGAATLTVSTDQDADALDGACSLREAILAANGDVAHNECPAGSGDDRIAFALPLPAGIVLASDLPAVTASLAIRGPGPDDLEINGAGLYRLFAFATPGQDGFFLLSGLTLRQGLAPATAGSDGGALEVGPGEWVRVERVSFELNRSPAGGGALAVEGIPGAEARAEVREATFALNQSQSGRSGGAIRAVDAVLFVEDSTFLANLAQGGHGGAVYLQRAVATFARSTFSGNAADVNGGAIDANALAGGGPTSIELRDSTLTANEADFDGDGSGDGGGLATGSSVGLTVDLTAVNSIVAGNLDDDAHSQPDLSMFVVTATLTTTGWNLIGDNEGGEDFFAAGAPNALGDFVGTAAAPIDPRLESLADNGGPTPTHRPLLEASSPVIDQGACPDAESDQRGWGDGAAGGRAFDHALVVDGAASDGCDIGAVERGAAPGSGSSLFADDFETGRLLSWDGEAP